MVRSDFIFKEGKLMVMPLDKDEKFKSQEWKEKNKNKENWDEVSIESVQYEDFIGYGANGVVLKGKEIIPNRDCAIKIWLPNQSSRTYNVFFEKYLEEVQKLAALKDPSIVSIHSANKTSNGYCYSIMEWVTGITLKEFLKRKPNLIIKERNKILNIILTTINECHKNIVFHGDLHHENILIVTDDSISTIDSVKILDFGTSLLNRRKRPEYSLQRESALLLKTTLQLFLEEKKYNLLDFKFYSEHSRDEIKHKDDVRNFHPLYVSTTLKNLNEIYYLLETNHINEEVFSDVFELALAAPGVNIISLLDQLSNKIEIDKMLIERIAIKFNEFFYGDKENIENKLLPCYFALLVEIEDLSSENNNYIYSNRKEVLELGDINEFYKWLLYVSRKMDADDYQIFVIEMFRDFHKMYWGENLDGETMFERQLILRDKINQLKSGSDIYSSIIKLYSYTDMD